jgi:hypothetical protein
MLRRTLLASALIGASLVPSPATARIAGVEVWTDRGHESVYQPGDGMRIQVRPSSDAYLLLYEIDAEGLVHVLFPVESGPGWVAGGVTHKFPSDESGLELVVQDPVGQAYLVAIASERPFRELPWYLQPADPFSELATLYGEADDEAGVTADGRIVGDPFVAMERIRRRVLSVPDDLDGFATSYTSYFVGTEVHYPRYVCYDCHRPGRWEWWDGFDPYYVACPVFGVRVNADWVWGPAYWVGAVPYFVYYYQPDCPPTWYDPEAAYWSSWDGWRRWTTLWGPKSLTRYKGPPPPGYEAPQPRMKPGFGTGPNVGALPAHKPSGRTPPGYVAGNDIAARRKPAVTGRGGAARPGEIVIPTPRMPGQRPTRPAGGSVASERKPVSGRPSGDRSGYEGGTRARPAGSPAPSSPRVRYVPPPKPATEARESSPPSTPPPSSPPQRVEPARPARQEPSPPPRTESRPAPPPDRGSGSDRPTKGDRTR